MNQGSSISYQRRLHQTLMGAFALLLAGIVFWLGWATLRTPVVHVPGVKGMIQAQPNVITSEYVEAFAQSWLDQRFTFTYRTFSDNALACAADVRPDGRVRFLKEMQALEKEVKGLNICQYGRNITVTVKAVPEMKLWMVEYHLDLQSYFGAANMGISVVKGELRVESVDTSASRERPLQIISYTTLKP